MEGKELEKLFSALSEFTCPDIDISIHSLADDALRYISLLKQEKEKMRVQTIKDILGILMSYCDVQGGVCYDVDIKRLAEKLCVSLEA